MLDERYLLIPLVTAERAWSYAIELKRDAGNEPRKRAHMIRRLKKATVHAAELAVGLTRLFPPTNPLPLPRKIEDACGSTARAREAT